TGLTATALTTTSIRVSWGNVPAGSQPATGWHTETRPVTSTGAWARVASDANARTVDITGLASGTAYDVRVRAVTAGGNSAWANTTVSTPAPEPAPGVPQDLAVAAVGTSAIDADWNAPVTGGSVTSYTLRWRPHGTNAAWSSRTGFSGRSGRITGLSPSTDYEVEVRANGPGGSSGYSAPARATTADPPAPGVPTMVAASAGDTTIRVTWGDPSDGGAAANFTVEWTAGGVGLTHTLAAGTNAYSITGLTNDAQYSIRVRASNAGGTSAWSPAVTATPEEVALMGPTFSRGPGNVVANIYIRIGMDNYHAPVGYRRDNNSAVEVEVSDGNAADHGWNNANPNNRTYAWWQVTRYRQWPHTTWPKQIRARISLTPTGGGANVWSNWETTTFAAASSAEPDRVFVPLVQDARLMALDDKLIGQENQT
ncbi:fibronectin type III domain-containing protein, partial [Candidatus Poribacteria bacterium]|nr:fibronectin type III domain-containing protein [Candidatus Poribacteria bacterium]